MIDSYRRDLAASIAATMGDYRPDELPLTGVDHVEAWVTQFPGDWQVPILREMDSVLRRTYLSRARHLEFVRRVIHDERLTQGNPQAFWPRTCFLEFSNKGQSQTALLEMYDAELKKLTGIGVRECGGYEDRFIYVDDALFSGTQMRWALINWIGSDAPEDACVDAALQVVCREPLTYLTQRVSKANLESGKHVRLGELVVDKMYQVSLDNGWSGEVLRPREDPGGEPACRLLSELAARGQRVRWRAASTEPTNQVFSSEPGRCLLEQAFLRAGAYIKYELKRDLPPNAWPLGYNPWPSLGFGTLVVTYGNCPNSAPLALWAGDPWYPLFPRRANRPNGAWGSSHVARQTGVEVPVDDFADVDYSGVDEDDYGCEEDQDDYGVTSAEGEYEDEAEDEDEEESNEPWGPPGAFFGIAWRRW